MSDVEQAKAHFFAALELLDAKDFAAAERELRAALAIVPDRVSALSNLAVALFEQDKTDDAVTVARQAIELAPDDFMALLSLGASLGKRGELTAALAAMERAVAVAPGEARPLIGRASVLAELKEYDRAIADYRNALRLSGSDDLLGRLISAQMYACDWTDIDRLTADFIAGVRSGTLQADPFWFLALPSTAADQLLCATVSTEREYPPMPAVHRGGGRSGRYRVAYISGDFRQHPLSQLMAGIFEHHDRDRFETFGVSIGPDDGSTLRARVAKGFDTFVDMRNRSDADIAAYVAEHDVDLAVDLGGQTTGGRPRIFARRPAPVQASYLGFPGTSGAPYIDYILADEIVIPADRRRFYSEQVVWLPDTYYPNDNRRQVAPSAPTRAAAGLPESGFVYCCFNNSYKITPAAFDVWMRILAAVDGSILWLLQSNPTSVENLQREARVRGVSPDRLVFAQNVKPDEYLARHRLADLFLDTLPYNAHTTACDALWAGLPGITCPGTTFVSRVAASILQAVGLPDLVTSSWDEYQALAVGLARDPARLASIKARLQSNRHASPLFDTARTTRHLEAAYAAMIERQRRGERPAAFAVEPVR